MSPDYSASTEPAIRIRKFLSLLLAAPQARGGQRNQAKRFVMSIACLPAGARRPIPVLDQNDDRLQLLRSMLVDRCWPCTPVVRGQLLEILASAAGTGCASECAWMTLAEEIARYLLYRRTGLQEAAQLEWQRPRREHVPATARRRGA
jgi:hypothetical protein